MNKQRRDQLSTASKALAVLCAKLNELMPEYETIKSDIEMVRNDEQDAYDNLPEAFQNGERGERMQEVIEELDTALEEIGEIIEMQEKFQSVVDHVDAAAA